MASADQSTYSKDQVAQTLASAHFQSDPGITRIFRLLARDDAVEGCADEPIKLLEINEHTIPNGIQPVRFGPDASDGILYPSVVIELTKGEFEQLEDGQLQLPNDWRRGEEYAALAGGQGN